MQTLLHPNWILITNTLPLLFVIFLFGYQFQLIEPFLNGDNLSCWKNTCLLSLGLTLMTTIVAFTYKANNRLLSYGYAIIAFVVYASFLYYLHSIQNELIPRNISRWRIINNCSTYLSTAIMPTLAHALLIIIIKLTPQEKNASAGFNFFCSLIIPFTWYGFVQLILPHWDQRGQSGIDYSFLLVIVSVVLFIFFLTRCFYIVTARNLDFWKDNKATYLSLISIIFPVCGLLLSNAITCFGDFSSKWFIGLALLNGLFLVCANSPNYKTQFLIFLGRCALLPYTIYFFVVFLPFLPWSVPAILLLGTGFLMLTPIVLLPVHFNILNKDLQFLSTHISKKYLYPTIFIPEFKLQMQLLLVN